jgi:hypothetical protein
MILFKKKFRPAKQNKSRQLGSASNRAVRP